MSSSLRPHGLYSPWNSPGQNTGVGSLFLHERIFPTQGSNPGLLHCRQILLLTELPGTVSDSLICRCVYVVLGGLFLYRLLQRVEYHSFCYPVRESFPRQVDRESRGPQGERGLEFSRRKKGQTFFLSLHSLGLYNNNVSCLRTVFGLNLLLS